MIPNPVFLNEIRQSAFRRHTVLVTFALLGTAVLTSRLALFGMSQIPLVYGPLILMPLVVPAIAAGAFAKEYEQQTWLDLYLTRLTNLEVVVGKFLAYFLQVAITLMALMPSLFFLLLGRYSLRLSALSTQSMPAEWQWAALGATLLVGLKFLLSCMLYILLAMVCSRYSPTRRAALIWSYIALALYSGFGWLCWVMVGSLDYGNQVQEAANSSSGGRPIDLIIPGFMESFHLIFCGVVGIGCIVLLWVSLSEQRGYKSSDAGQTMSRAWQPIAKRPS